MANEQAKKGYPHWVPEAKPDNEWRKKLQLKLVNSLEDLKALLLSLGNYVAWDLETSSLSPEEGFIVGVALTDNPSKGYYIPIRHHTGTSLGDTALKMIDKMLHTRKMTFLFNARFDLRYWEYVGFDGSTIPIFDVQDSCWMADTNVKRTSLKFFERHFLGWMPDTFTETLGDKENFYYVTPEEATPYAAVDAAGTMTLAYHTMPYWQESRQAGKIDQAMLYPLMKWENTKLPIDRKVLEEIAISVDTQIQEIQQRIYRMAGIQFKINSNRDCTEVFERLGIDTGHRIKSGYMKVGIPELEATNREHPHPILKDMVAYKKLFKVQSGYVSPLTVIAQEGFARFAYLTCRAPTARFASGKDGKNPFFSPVNVQSIPKPKPTMWYVREATQEEKDKGEDILGYHMSLTEKSDMWMEGFDPKLNLRRAFVADPDGKHYFVSCDMCLEGGTPVISNRGYMGISELKVGDKIRTPNGWAEVLDVHETEPKRLFRTRTNNQSIYSSPDHPFLLNGELIRAEEFTGSLKTEEIKSYCKEWEDRESLKRDLNELKSMSLTPYECADEIKRRGWLSKIETGIAKYSRGFVADSLGVRRSSFGHTLRKLSVKGNGKELRAEKFWACNNPFEGESNPTSAYLLGYIVGDGSITVGSRWCLNISSKDREHLSQIMSVFAGSSEVKPHTRGKYEWYSLSINSKEVVQSLLRLGVQPDKSHKGVELPVSWLGSNLPHFLRGLIDSDGPILLKNGALCIDMYGHESYIEKLGELLDEPTRIQGAVEGVTIHGDREKKKLIYQSLYSHATIWLQRKRDVIEEYLGYFSGKETVYWSMYDITIASEDHIYYAGGVPTHNSGEELRIVANLYKEPVWVNAFLTGSDVHKATAVACFGEENYDKQKRRMAKVVNFGKIYGMSPQSMQEKFPELSLDFCEQFMKDYVKGLPYIFSGQDRDIRRAKKEGTVYTVFGRPRRVKYWLQSPDPKMRGFGARTVKNSQVQGAGGDLLRLMVKRIWDALFAPGTYDIQFRSTVHDEINFSVARAQALEIIPKIIKCMTVKVPGWSVPMECGLEVGTSWGQTFAFDYNLETNTYTPHWEPVPEDHEEPEPEVEEEIDPDIYWEEETEEY